MPGSGERRGTGGTSGTGGAAGMKLPPRAGGAGSMGLAKGSEWAMVAKDCSPEWGSGGAGSPGTVVMPWATCETNHAGRYPSMGRPGLTASHQSSSGQASARAPKRTRREEPALSLRHAARAVSEVKARMWVRSSVVQVAQVSAPPSPVGSS